MYIFIKNISLFNIIKVLYPKNIVNLEIDLFLAKA